MPRYFFDVKDGRRLFDSAGFICDDDTDAIVRASVLAIGVSIDKPEDDPERRISIINDAGREIGTVPVYSTPSYENPAQQDAVAMSAALCVGGDGSRRVWSIASDQTISTPSPLTQRLGIIRLRERTTHSKKNKLVL